METIPKSPLATFMKGLITSKNFECTEIVTDNPRRLSSTSSRPSLLLATGEAQNKHEERWEFSEKNENECINCPQRRASIDDDDLFSDEEFSASYSDNEDDTNSHTTSTTSTPLPSSPLSPFIGRDANNHIGKNSDDAELPYQMALRMVQKKYAASSLSSPSQSPIQPPKKLVPGIRGDSSSRRSGP